MTTHDVASAFKSEYGLDNAWVQARERLAALEARADPRTIRQLEALGVSAGWQCLEIGGGGGSITKWLCQRVGTSGRVVATDINTRFLEALDFQNLEVRSHNIVEDELEQGAFDLVHTRAVLFHLSRRETALERMVDALKPGGLLLVEEPDYSSCVADPRVGDVASRLFLKVHDVAEAATGVDFKYGRRLNADVCALGLVNVGAEGRVYFGRGGTQDGQFYRLTILQARDRILGTGQISPEELDTFIALFDDPDFVWMSNVAVAVWGHRPTA